MASGFGESPQNPSCPSGSNSNDAGDFECNICFDLAQDPVVTLCGHLFCWPCLYKWLHHHSQAQECPVCKALIQEEKLVPLYGRGKSSSDPRSRPVPGVNIPNRPTGQRPETAPIPERNPFAHHGFGMMGGTVPMASTRFGNFALSAGFGGLFPSLFNIQLHRFPNRPFFGSTSAFHNGYFDAFPGGHGHGHAFPQQANRPHEADHNLKNLLLMIGFFVLLALLMY